VRLLGENYSHLWAILVVNKGDTFTTSVWRDTAEGAERFVKQMYPYAETVIADRDSGHLERE
jgi:hypothetical protein